ncbi:MAG: tRNA pseudouridine(55) synthase TruB [Alphaproteobacteria bacterium]|nr:tRNA pseudouridine(55) synthase TruB [Alphaproteobacteria bacterium]
MGRRRKGDKVDGWVNFDKPLEMTSTQAVGKVRWLYNAQKAGHAGTLDPLATGILPIALGEATKTIPFMQDALKTYFFTIKWGEQRSTDDTEGDIIATSDIRPSAEDINAALPAYIGDIQQVPPKFSAIKVDGQRAYDLARDGEDVQLKARSVYIHSLELLETRADEADFRMICGKGTYVRSLARDLALDLGTKGYIALLRREAVGGFGEKNAILLDKLEDLRNSARLDEALLPLSAALDDIPALALKENEIAPLKNGQVLSFVSKPDFDRLEKIGLAANETALATFQGKAIALIEVEGAQIKPVRVFNT